jgi:hypothetical protein
VILRVQQLDTAIAEGERNFMLNHSDTNTVKRYVHGIAPDAALGRVLALLDGASAPTPSPRDECHPKSSRCWRDVPRNHRNNAGPSAPFGQPLPKGAPNEIVWRLSLSFSRLSRPPTKYIFGKV